MHNSLGPGYWQSKARSLHDLNLVTPKTLLVIDDDVDFCEVVTSVFSDEGFEVIHALDAASGIELALTRAPDVVLIDYLLPDRHGLEAVRELRRFGFSAPTLMLTGADGMPAHAIWAGADSCLKKPIELQKLFDAVREALQRSPQ